MGFWALFEPRVLGDVEVASLVAFSLKQPRNPALSWKKSQPLSATSGLTGCPECTAVAVTRLSSVTVLFSIVASGLLSGGADAKTRPSHNPAVPACLVETRLSLTPFQHVRFCLRHPADCRSNLTEDERIEMTGENSKLLDRVNRDVNAAIEPVQKSYGKNLQQAWTIVPLTGDCNDYAVTKRHELIRSGLPARALRLAVVKTKSGHLVLLAATSKGDLMLDNLTDAIVPWQSTDYQWMKIQSASDARSWHEVKVSGASVSPPDPRLRVTDRQ
jgi:predicted transglutaminase-like cysteine proteinase